MLDSIVSRYHWTLEYILWGISWVNLHLMIRDSITFDYRSKDGTATEETVGMDDPETIKQSLKDIGL